MIVHHLMIGTSDLETTFCFYSDVLGYVLHTSFIDTGTGKKGYILRKKKAPEILLVPFAKTRLPSPQHIAFELELSAFKSILHQCNRLKVTVRGLPELDSTTSGPVEFEEGAKKCQRFYIADPSGVNLEFLTQMPITLQKKRLAG